MTLDLDAYYARLTHNLTLDTPCPIWDTGCPNPGTTGVEHHYEQPVFVPQSRQV
jgi:hypothetical protein